MLAAGLIDRTVGSSFKHGLTNFIIQICRHRIPKEEWWLKLRPLLRILSKHDSTYEEEGMYMSIEDRNVHDAII